MANADIVEGEQVNGETQPANRIVGSRGRKRRFDDEGVNVVDVVSDDGFCFIDDFAEPEEEFADDDAKIFSIFGELCELVGFVEEEEECARGSVLVRVVAEDGVDDPLQVAAEVSVSEEFEGWLGWALIDVRRFDCGVVIVVRCG